MREGRGEAHTGCWCENLREREKLGDPRVDGKIILSWIFKNWDGGGEGAMKWIELAQDRDKWWALVNAVMNLQVP
jgi:hypothetical protein